MVDSTQFKLRSTRLGIDSYRRCNATSMHKITPICFLHPITREESWHYPTLYWSTKSAFISSYLHGMGWIYKGHAYISYIYTHKSARNTDISFVSKSILRQTSSIVCINKMCKLLTIRRFFVCPHARRL